jgi:hypothetical protein
VTGIQPELWADRPREAITFYQAAFGARVVHQAGEGEDIVAQLAVGDACFWVANTDPGKGRFSAVAIGGGTSRTLLVTGDPDTMVSAAPRRRRRHDLAGRRRTRLAARPHHRPLRPPLGDRHTHRAVATLNNTAPPHQPRTEPPI